MSLFFDYSQCCVFISIRNITEVCESNETSQLVASFRIKARTARLLNVFLCVSFTIALLYYILFPLITYIFPCTDVYFCALLLVINKLLKMVTILGENESQSMNIFKNRFPDLKLSWAGYYNGLKLYVNNDLKIEGEWSSSGGERKLFVGEDIKICWWKNKKFSTVEGKRAGEVKRLLFSHIFGDLLETFSDAEQPESRHKSCNCYEMSSDIEGVKLDVTILEAKLEQHSNLTSQMRDKLTKQCSKLDSTQSKRHDIPVCRDIHDDVQVIHADFNLQQQQSTSSSVLENNANPPFLKLMKRFVYHQLKIVTSTMVTVH